MISGREWINGNFKKVNIKFFLKIFKIIVFKKFLGPILESPISIQQGFTFIPNPTDGQLYVVVEGRLSKLPFTIPQLVKVSPCRSNDGILYAGIFILKNLK